MYVFSKLKDSLNMSVIKYKNIADEPVTAEVISISGEVLEVNRSNKTHLHASGGGSSASSSNGRAYARTSPVSVSSTNTVHDDIYLLTDSGEEVFIQLVNWEHAGIRKGHHVQAIWLKVNINDKKNFSTSYALVNNRDLKKVHYNDDVLTQCISVSSFFKAISQLS